MTQFTKKKIKKKWPYKNLILVVKLKELKYVREVDVSSQFARSELQNKILFQFYVLYFFSVKDGEVSHENH